MSNRKRIEIFCRKNNLKIIDLHFEKNTDHIYGDSSDASGWNLRFQLNDEVHDYFSFKGNNTVAEDIEDMLEAIENDVLKYTSRRKRITEEEYEEIMNMKPEERVRDCGNVIENKIGGILIAFSRLYDMRDGWIDIITLRDAEKEIKQLIKDCGGNA